MPINRPKPLFKVASEFNVSTQSIVDTLEDNGLTASNRPNFKITPDMYIVLEQVYGEDKAKSADHERAKEAYESRRSQMMNQRYDSVTVDQFLEPLEEEEEAASKTTTSIEDDLLGGLEPMDESPSATQELKQDDVAAELEQDEKELTNNTQSEITAVNLEKTEAVESKEQDKVETAVEIEEREK